MSDQPAAPSVYVEVIFTFEGSVEKTLHMTPQDYHKLKVDIQNQRRPGSEASITLGLQGGEFLLPWGKVIFAEAFLRGTPDPAAVSQQILAGPPVLPPAPQ